MSTYQLQIKQIVDYPKCRIYRQLIQSLIKDPNIRTNGSSGLFYYTVLCCYANFRTSYKRIDGLSYTIHPGEWLLKIVELKKILRCKTIRQAIGILNDLQNKHLIEFSILGRGSLVKFSVNNWCETNRALDYNAPCQKQTGFYFLPISVANELVGSGKCSEMDTILDLWINTVYNDERVQGSDVGPLVYIRNGSGSPILSCKELSQRWGLSKTTASRYLDKFKKLGYIDIVSFPGSIGSVICIRNYLSTMFEISDILLDKQELALALNIEIDIPNVLMENDKVFTQNITVSNYLNSVPKTPIEIIIEKVAKILSLQGFACCSCPKTEYILLPLSECKDTNIIPIKAINRETSKFMLIIKCSDKELFRFNITLQREYK